MTAPVKTTRLDEQLGDAVSSPAFEQDPFPVYDLMLQAPPWRAPSGPVVVSKHRSLHRMLVDHETFGQHLAPWPNFHRLNPPDHTRLRRLVSKAFTPRSIRTLESAMGRVSHRLLDDADLDGFDLIGDYAYHLPARIIAEMIGVPAADGALWQAWLVRMGAFNFQNPLTAKDPVRQAAIVEDAQAANREQAEYFVGIIENRRRTPGEDIVTRLIEAREDDDSLTDEEIRYVLVLLLQGGLHTTVYQIGNTVHALLAHPEQLAQVRADPELVRPAIEESLRWDGVLQTEVRVARRPTDVEGFDVDEGEHLITVHAAANRDPRVFDHPATFDIHRPNAEQHFAFGFGVHYCIGAPLARAELHAAVRHLLALPGFELAGDPVRDPLFRIRGFSSMPVKATGRLPAATEDA